MQSISSLVHFLRNFPGRNRHSKDEEEGEEEEEEEQEETVEGEELG